MPEAASNYNESQDHEKHFCDPSARKSGHLQSTQHHFEGRARKLNVGVPNDTTDHFTYK